MSETKEFELTDSSTFLDAKFKLFRAAAEKLSTEVLSYERGHPLEDPAEYARSNLEVAKVIFGKWSLEIMILLYTLRSLGFEEIKKNMRGISSKVLSQKLKEMEAENLIQRQVIETRPLRVKYMLTEDGLTVAKLGEPVFLFLSFRTRSKTNFAESALI